MADDHATHRKAIPKLASCSRNPEAAAATTIGISGCDQNIPVASGGEKIGPEVKPAHTQHSLADVSVALAEGSARKDLKQESRASGGALGESKKFTSLPLTKLWLLPPFAKTVAKDMSAGA